MQAIDPTTWSLQSVQSLISDLVEENLNLEYKSADALGKAEGKKKEISKDVSAMANAAGGTLIYGVKEFDETSKRHLPAGIDPVNRNEHSKEWLEQVINTNIHPKIDHLIITPVTIDDQRGLVIYIVDIPQSNTAHQANDKRYYKRFNFENLAMDDYEIRDIMARSKHPDISLEFQVEVKNQVERDAISGIPKSSFTHPLLKPTTPPKNWQEFRIKIFMVNKGRVFANYVNYYLELPSEILHNDENYLNDSPNREGFKELYGENTIRDVMEIQKIAFNSFNKYGPSRFDPILPGTRSRSKTIRLKDDFMSWDKELCWKIYADNAEVKTGSINLSTLVQQIKFVNE